jgi:hypothetical protein
MKNWLQDYLADAVSRRLCTKVYCTTCGTKQFRDGLPAAVSHQAGRSLWPPKDVNAAMLIGRALAEILPDDDPRYSEAELEAAARFVLTDIWNALGDAKADEAITSVLAHSWAGRLLDRMKTHYAARLEERRRREEYESLERVAERREEKDRIKQGLHAARNTAKRERETTNASKHWNYGDALPIAPIFWMPHDVQMARGMRN